MDNLTSVQKFLQSEVSFYITIVAAVFTIAAMYFGLTGRIDLLTQKLEFSNTVYNELDLRIKAIDQAHIEIQKELILLQAKLGKNNS